MSSLVTPRFALNYTGTICCCTIREVFPFSPATTIPEMCCLYHYSKIAHHILMVLETIIFFFFKGLQ